MDRRKRRRLLSALQSGILEDIRSISNTDIASFTGDGHDLVRLVVAIEPVQSLNGYDNPWPAGGGANKYPESAISGTNNAVTVTQNGGSYSLSGTASAYTQFISTESFTLQAGTYTLKEFNWVASIYVQLWSLDGQSIYANTAGAESNTFTLASETTVKARIVVNANTVTNRTIQIEIVSGSTAPSVYTPYSNICPISGWTEATVMRTGKNLLSPHIYKGIGYSQSVGETVSLTDSPVQLTDNHDGTFTYTTSSTWDSNIFLLPVKQNTSYFRRITIASSANLGTGYGYLDGDFKVLSYSNSTTNPRTLSAALGIPAEAKYMFLLFSNRTSASATITITNPQVEISSAASSYEAYRGETYTIDLDGTRYGGTLDATTGKLMVTDGYIASYDEETLPSTWISDRDVYAAGTNPTNGAEVVYKLATPIEVQLTPTQIATLSGANNIWTDTGDIILLEYVV